jgi:hypothetical protein
MLSNAEKERIGKKPFPGAGYMLSLRVRNKEVLMPRLFPLFLVLVSAAFGDILFQDDFDDGNADGWHEISMIHYDVIEGEYQMYGGYAENHGISFNGDDSGYMSTPDYSATCVITPEVGVFFGMMCRFVEDSDYKIMLVINDLNQSLTLYRWHSAGLTLLDQAAFPVQMNQQYRLRYEVSSDTFRGKAWIGEAGDEPAQWMVSCTDTMSSAGSVALFCAGISADVSLSCFFDDVVVCDPLSSLSSFTWAAIKSHP